VVGSGLLKAISTRRPKVPENSPRVVISLEVTNSARQAASLPRIANRNLPQNCHQKTRARSTISLPSIQTEGGHSQGSRKRERLKRYSQRRSLQVCTALKCEGVESGSFSGAAFCVVGIVFITRCYWGYGCSTRRDGIISAVGTR